MFPFKVVCIALDCYNRAVLPCTIRSSMTKPPEPLLEHGIVIYVYSDDRCKSTNKYMAELEYNIKQIKSKEPRVAFSVPFLSRPTSHW